MFGAHLWATGPATAALAAAAILLRKNDRLFLPAILVAALFASWFLYGVDSQVFKNSPLAVYVEETGGRRELHRVWGTVTSASKTKYGSVSIVLDVDSIAGENGDPIGMSGLISLWYPDDAGRTPRVGERWLFEGRLKTVGGMKPHQQTFYRMRGVSASMSLAKWGAREKAGKERGHFLMRAGEKIRDRFGSILDRNVASPYNQVLGQMMLGRSKEMDATLYEEFRRAGLTHILVVSGMNVMIMLGAFLFISFVWKRRPVPSFIVLSALLVFYYAATGGGPSILRATIMGFVFLTGLLFGANYNPKSGLFIAALFMMVIDPLVIFNVGAQLTFLAAGGVIFIYPAMAVFVSSRRLWAKAARVALVAVAAQLPIYPLLAYYFNQFCVVSPVSNLLVVPLAGVLLPIDFITCVVGLIPGPLVAAPAFAAEAVARLIVFLTRVLAAFPFSTVDVASPSAAWMALYGAGVVLLVLTLRWMARGTDERIVTGWLLVALVGAVLITWDLWRPPLRDMRVTFFDVGEGDSALVEIPSGGPREGVFRALVDGGGSWGSSAGTFDAGERIIGRTLRADGIRRLDAVFLSHPDMDHMNGLVWTLGNIKVDRFIDAAFFTDTACEAMKNAAACELYRKTGAGPANPGPGRRERYAEILNAAKKGKAEYMPVRGGAMFTMPSGAKLLILSPERDAAAGDVLKNNMSLVMKAMYGRGAVLFTGDIQSETEAELTGRYGGLLKASVLKVPHHGSSTSSTYGFLASVKPEAAVISTGGPSFYGHPHSVVLDTYKRMKVPVWRTDAAGTVVCNISPGGSVRCRPKHIYRLGN